MYILVCGYPSDKLEDFMWIGESEEKEFLYKLREKRKKNELLKNQIFIIFSLKDFTDIKYNSLDNKFNCGVEMRGE